MRSFGTRHSTSWFIVPSTLPFGAVDVDIAVAVVLVVAPHLQHGEQRESARPARRRRACSSSIALVPRLPADRRRAVLVAPGDAVIGRVDQLDADEARRPARRTGGWAC